MTAAMERKQSGTPGRKLMRSFGPTLIAGLAAWAFLTGRVPGFKPGIHDAVWRDNMVRTLPGIVVLVAFSVYWSVAAQDRAADRTAESPWSARLHQMLVAAALLLIVVRVPGVTMRLLPASSIFVVLGLAVECAGVGLAIWARRHLGRNWSREVRIGEGHQLVRSGPYKHLRHPIYTGALGMYLGLALMAGRLGSLLGLALVVLAYLRKVGLEERLLQSAFGSAFADYRACSWAIVPLLY
jgi:protein-S-isoprenylcysteine O-methyltransferase Ste14